MSAKASKRGRPHDAAQDGFTLLEILVALVVFGLLLVGLSQGADFGLRAWDRQARVIEAHGEIDAVDRALRRMMTGMDPESAVIGEAHALTFAATLPERAGVTDPAADIQLRVDARHRLVLRSTPHRHALRLKPLPPPDETELLRDVARVDFAYWPRGEAAGWQQSWQSAGLPALIRIRLVFAAGDPRRWPDIVIAPVREPAGG